MGGGYECEASVWKMAAASILLQQRKGNGPRSVMGDPLMSSATSKKWGCPQGSNVRGAQCARRQP